MNILINDYPQDDLRKRYQAYERKHKKNLSPEQFHQQLLRAQMDAFDQQALNIGEDWERCARIVQSNNADKLIDAQLHQRYQQVVHHQPTTRQWLREFTPYEFIY